MLRAVNFAEEKGNQAAGREFGVSKKVVRDWCQAVFPLRCATAQCHHTICAVKSLLSALKTFQI